MEKAKVYFTKEITEESLEDYSFISQLFWRTHPYIFALNNDVYGTWIYYYKDYTIYYD